MRLSTPFLVFAGVGSCLAAVPRGAAPENDALVTDERMPLRVHVFEDYETEIEKRWWLRGQAIGDDLPPSRSMLPNRRACRSTATKDFDDKQGDAKRDYRAVIFNPVPGPPMAGKTRLRFRYWLDGTDELRVQIYSLTLNYHRRLTLAGLPKREWREATVDMTRLRRPDGSGGPLAADERIDDIQFYVADGALVRIDDIVLYEPGTADERRPFPRRVIFTGWFDTGKQGAEWPGTFEIVPHTAPRTWKFARSVRDSESGGQQICVGLRGIRHLSPATRLRFWCHRAEPCELTVVLCRAKGSEIVATRKARTPATEWGEVEVAFEIPADKEASADEVRITADGQHPFSIDDLLLYEPAREMR